MKKEKILYIDMTTCMPNQKQKFHGGGNYAFQILSQLNDFDTSGWDINLICPKLSSENQESINKLKIMTKFTINYVNVSVEEIEFQENSIVYFPLLFFKSTYKSILCIKKLYKNIRIYATIHDCRNVYTKIDWLDRYYADTVFFQMAFPYLLFEKLYCRYTKRIIQKTLNKINKVFTVSNYSLQCITDINPNIRIIPVYQTVKISSQTIYNSQIDYRFILFVSGNRRVKNLLRTLIAFCEYKHQTENDLYLVVTGISDSTMKLLKRYHKLDLNILNKWVITYDYVGQDFLDELYDKMEFLLYTAKNEGFGLPLLEAAMHGKSAVASYATSIPEVLGNMVFYINPYDKNSIIDAIKFMADIENRYQRENAIKQSKDILKRRMEIDRKIFLDELLEK